MSGSLNKVILIGNLTRDPEVRTTPSGAKVANFSIAINENYKDKQGQKVDKTEFINIVLWKGLADVAERYLRKGASVCIEGKITTRTWDKPDGTKGYVTDIVGNNMQMLGGKSEGDSQGQPSEQSGLELRGGHNTELPPEPDDDLPF